MVYIVYNSEQGIVCWFAVLYLQCLTTGAAVWAALQAARMVVLCAPTGYRTAAFVGAYRWGQGNGGSVWRLQVRVRLYIVQYEGSN